MLENLINEFNIKGKLIKIETNNSENINNTYVATFKKNNNKSKKYLIKKRPTKK